MFWDGTVTTGTSTTVWLVVDISDELTIKLDDAKLILENC